MTLSLLDAQADATQLSSSGDPLEPGVWILAVRLRSGYQLAAFIPVVKVVITETGDVSRTRSYDGELGVKSLTQAAGAITSRRGSKAARPTPTAE